MDMMEVNGVESDNPIEVIEQYNLMRSGSLDQIVYRQTRHGLLFQGSVKVYWDLTAPIKLMQGSKDEAGSSLLQDGSNHSHKEDLFLPSLDCSWTNVRVTNRLSSVDVIRLMFSKYQVDADCADYVLYFMQRNECKRLSEKDIPLNKWLEAGASNRDNKLILREREADVPNDEYYERVLRTSEVQEYINFPVPMLRNFVDHYVQLEQRDLHYIRSKYRRLAADLQSKLRGEDEEGTLTDASVVDLGRSVTTSWV